MLVALLLARVGFALSAAMQRPLPHELAPLLKQVASAVGCFDLVTDGVGECHLGHLAWKIRGFGAPVAKGGAKAVRHGIDLHAAHHGR